MKSENHIFLMAKLRPFDVEIAVKVNITLFLGNFGKPGYHHFNYA